MCDINHFLNPPRTLYNNRQHYWGTQIPNSTIKQGTKDLMGTNSFYYVENNKTIHKENGIFVINSIPHQQPVLPESKSKIEKHQQWITRPKLVDY